MGKNDFLSPKAIGNRIKAKGLQKLRWYCQLCQKQCRDENGFKCHQLSDSHRRQMDLFGENAERVVEGFSEEFESSFLEHMRVAHPSSRVAAKVVYNEYINDKNHIHMNSTQWYTLTEFVKYLGRTGKCKVDETPKGWFMSLIQRDAAQELEEEKRNKRQQHELEEGERQVLRLKEQAERARRAAPGDEGCSAGTALLRNDSDAPIVLSLQPGVAAGVGAAAGEQVRMSGKGASVKRPAAVVFVDDEDADVGGSGRGGEPPKKLSKLDKLMLQGKLAKERQAAAVAAAAAAAKMGEGKAAPSGSEASGTGRRDHWLAPGIVVKVMSKELKEHGYYKQKGMVDRVVGRYVGEICMQDSGDVIRVDQEQLETVLPAAGGTVLILNGPHLGSRGTLLAIDTDRFQAEVRLTEGPQQGRSFWFEYEDVSRVASKG